MLRRKGNNKAECEGAALFASTLGKTPQERYGLYVFVQAHWGPKKFSGPNLEKSGRLEALGNFILDVNLLL